MGLLAWQVDYDIARYVLWKYRQTYLQINSDDDVNLSGIKCSINPWRLFGSWEKVPEEKSKLENGTLHDIFLS